VLNNKNYYTIEILNDFNIKTILHVTIWLKSQSTVKVELKEANTTGTGNLFDADLVEIRARFHITFYDRNLQKNVICNKLCRLKNKKNILHYSNGIVYYVFL